MNAYTKNGEMSGFPTQGRKRKAGEQPVMEETSASKTEGNRPLGLSDRVQDFVKRKMEALEAEVSKVKADELKNKDIYINGGSFMGCREPDMTDVEEEQLAKLGFASEGHFQRRVYRQLHKLWEDLLHYRHFPHELGLSYEQWLRSELGTFLLEPNAAFRAEYVKQLSTPDRYFHLCDDDATDTDWFLNVRPADLVARLELRLNGIVKSVESDRQGVWHFCEDGDAWFWGFYCRYTKRAKAEKRKHGKVRTVKLVDGYKWMPILPITPDDIEENVRETEYWDDVVEHEIKTYENKKAKTAYDAETKEPAWYTWFPSEKITMDRDMDENEDLDESYTTMVAECEPTIEQGVAKMNEGDCRAAQILEAWMADSTRTVLKPMLPIRGRSEEGAVGARVDKEDMAE